MTKKDILLKLNDIFKKVFNNNLLNIDENSNHGNIEGWDSLIHIQLVIEIESSFGIKMTAEEIQQFDSIDELLKIIITKI